MKKIILSLTGENSHVLEIPKGQGSLSIGTIGMDKKQFDVLVDPSLPINWDTFNSSFTGHGQQNKDIYPYGDWPRFIYYSGNDLGFAKWTIKRETEDFHWTPQKDIKVDLSQSNIRYLSIHSTGYLIEIDFGKEKMTSLQNLHLSGSLEKIQFSHGRKLQRLSLSLPINTLEIPKLNALTNTDSLNISSNVIGIPLDCRSLLQFSHVKSLTLQGNMIGLEVLNKFKKLEFLVLRKMPNLDHLPELNRWDNLKSLIAVDIEEIHGKQLRKELRTMKKDREMVYSTVSGLRKSIWFTTEYGIPFTSWRNNAGKAISKYKSTVKLLKKLEERIYIEEIIKEFTEFFNQFDNIETSERENVYEAVLQLIQVPKTEIDAKEATEWFDNARDY